MFSFFWFYCSALFFFLLIRCIELKSLVLCYLHFPWSFCKQRSRVTPNPNLRIPASRKKSIGVLQITAFALKKWLRNMRWPKILKIKKIEVISLQRWIEIFTREFFAKRLVKLGQWSVFHEFSTWKIDLGYYFADSKGRWAAVSD